MMPPPPPRDPASVVAAAANDEGLGRSAKNGGVAWQLDEEALKVDQLYTRAITAASQSLGYRETPESHALLADLYWVKARDAERAQDYSNMLYFRSLVGQHEILLPLIAAGVIEAEAKPPRRKPRKR